MTSYSFAFMPARYSAMFALVLLLFLPGLAGAAGPSVIHDIRLWRAPDSTRIVFDLSQPAKHGMHMETPTRIVLDVPNATLQVNPGKLSLQETPIAALRTYPQAGGTLRLVLDLKAPVRASSFFLAKNPPMGDRLVLDLFDEVVTDEAADMESILGKATTPGAAAVREAKPATTMVIETPPPRQPVASRPEAVAQPASGAGPAIRAAAAHPGRRDLVIAIDAGHGGEDPGALGPERIREKDVVLQIAKKLEEKFRKEPGYKPMMVRKGDYYVGLSQRRDIARKHNADLFVSIHADAFTRPQANGSSVYALSGKGATSASAQFLADKENQSDLIGGVSLDDKDAVLSSVLVDLSMTYKMESSLEVGAGVLRKMANVSRLHSNRVEQAAFAVLKTPDIPSILVETGFISNHAEAKKLSTPSYQQQMANAIFEGIHHYFLRKAPEGTYIAWKGRQTPVEGLHIVVSGETLSQIAQRYSVSMNTLVSYNKLPSTNVKVGQHIRIPPQVR